jgi:hypothetical protein
MSLALTVIIIPYVVNILLKLISLTSDEKVMGGALDDLVNLPKPAGEGVQLDHDQRAIIVERLSASSLKTTAILTSLASLFAAITIVLSNQQIAKTSTALWILLFFLVLGVIIVLWLLPKRMDFFGARGWLGIRKGTWASLALCGFDLSLGILSVLSDAYPTR